MMPLYALRSGMKPYADRFLAASYEGDEPVSLGLARPDADPLWEVHVPESLFGRTQAISSACNLHLLPVIDPYRRSRLTVEQCRTLADALVFVAEAVNDELLRRHVSAILDLVKWCMRESGGQELVIEGP
jgi:hypothetical protein